MKSKFMGLPNSLNALYSLTQTLTPPKNTKITEYANHTHTVNTKRLYSALLIIALCGLCAGLPNLTSEITH